MSHRFKSGPPGIGVRRRGESRMDYDLRRGIQATVTNQQQLEAYVAQLGAKIADKEERELFQMACIQRILPWLRFTPKLPLAIWQQAQQESLDPPAFSG